MTEADPERAEAADGPEDAQAAVPSLADVAAEVDWPDTDREREARGRMSVLAVAPNALGRLEDLAVWMAGVQGQCPPRELTRPRIVLFGADHGIAARDVSVRPAGATTRDLEQARAGGGVTGVLAAVADVGVRVVDLATLGGPADGEYRIRDASGAIDVEDALTTEQFDAAVAAGIALADAEIDGGADLLLVGDVGTGSTTAAAVVISVVTGTEPVKVIGRGSGVDDEGWMRKVTVIRDARRRIHPHRADPAAMLRVGGGADLTTITAFLLRAAARRTPVVLDGLVVGAAALVARELAPRSIRWWRAGHRSSEPGHIIAIDRLRLDPVLDLELGLGGGAGALLAVPLLHAAVRLAADLDLDPAKEERLRAEEEPTPDFTPETPDLDEPAEPPVYDDVEPDVDTSTTTDSTEVDTSTTTDGAEPRPDEH